MADRTVTVKSSGGDYTSLNAALSGESTDLVSNTRVLTIEHYRNDDSTLVSFGTGWVANDTYYGKIIAPSGYRHAGKYDTNKSGVFRTADWSSVVIMGSGYWHIEYMQFETSGGYSTVISTAAPAGSAIRFYFKNCIFINTSSSPGTAESYAVVHPIGYTTTAGTDHKAVLCNCVIIRPVSIGYLVSANLYAAYQTIFVYNCTLVGGDYAFYRLNGSSYGNPVRNCLFYNQDTGIDSGGNCNTSVTSYVSCSLDTDDFTSVTGERHNQTFTFVDAANHDYHLQSGDAGAKDYGTDLSSNPDSAPLAPLSTDIDGDTRSGSWDIGADEYVAAVTAVAVPVHLIQHNPMAQLMGR